MSEWVLRPLILPVYICLPRHPFPVDPRPQGLIPTHPQSSYFSYLSSARPKFWLWIHTGSRQRLPTCMRELQLDLQLWAGS